MPLPRQQQKTEIRDPNPWMSWHLGLVSGSQALDQCLWIKAVWNDFELASIVRVSSLTTLFSDKNQNSISGLLLIVYS
jgi:hypothetical protein